MCATLSPLAAAQSGTEANRHRWPGRPPYRTRSAYADRLHLMPAGVSRQTGCHGPAANQMEHECPRQDRTMVDELDSSPSAVGLRTRATCDSPDGSACSTRRPLPFLPFFGRSSTADHASGGALSRADNVQRTAYEGDAARVSSVDPMQARQLRPGAQRHPSTGFLVMTHDRATALCRSFSVSADYEPPSGRAGGRHLTATAEARQSHRHCSRASGSEMVAPCPRDGIATGPARQNPSSA